MAFHLILALQALQAVSAPAAAPPADPLRYSGWDRRTEVHAPRGTADIQVNGSLDEPVWKTAAVLTGFSQYKPVDGVQAEDSTEVLVWYGETAIHFGIRAYERHLSLTPSLADRDKIDSEDYVQLLLDTYNDKRRALVFSVSPLGVQSDGTRSEGGASVRAGFGEQQDISGLDLSPDFVYESKGRVTEYGYEVEVRIPFKTLRFQSESVQTWGFNVIRKVQHSGHEQTWTPARIGNNSFLAQSGQLVGLTDLRHGLVLDVTPIVTWKSTGTPLPASPGALPGTTGWRYDSETPDFGGNIRWGITTNLALTGTIKPDFSQVEADVAQVQSLPRNAQNFAEKRPFFLEGIEQLQMPKQIIYTRRIVLPVAAAKLSGKVNGMDVGFVSAVDDKQLSATGDNPIFNLLRVRRDLGSKSWIGAVYTDKVDGDEYNRVGGIDTRYVFGDYYYVQFQGTGSVSNLPVSNPSISNKLRPLYHGVFDRTSRRWNLHSEVFGTHPEFLPAAGFLTRGGIFQSNILNRFTFFGKPGAKLESWSWQTRVDGLWEYDKFFDGRNADEVKFHNTWNFNWRGGWRLGPFLYIENFYYPPSLYETYRLERSTPAGTDTIPFTANNQTLFNVDVGFGMSTPRFARFDASANILVGHDDNFFEWAPAWIWLSTFIVNARPTDKIRLETRWVRQQYIRMTDRSNVGVRNIPRVKLEYQVLRPVFLRFVGQYDQTWRDAFRDDSRTEYPILILNSRTRAYERSLRTRTNNFRGDVLFSYQPNPGTVFFAGYGSTLIEDQSFRFRELERTTDGFFVKVSYLFRL